MNANEKFVSSLSLPSFCGKMGKDPPGHKCITAELRRVFNPTQSPTVRDL